ncbi:helix-turn-helix domain-containing protein [Tropicibacter sp. Alg240-R139]|uniref:helix-turn-helix domain-containing protein n=1 Tax=Tropicibacter sp. Alg240-R139 TaxID=2305991 RepID=UPI0013DF7C3A|nr:helix-turn-helix domain-containing protein [Tropicibacter sp. Alg240-R139]
MIKRNRPETSSECFQIWELTDPTNVQNSIEVLDQDIIALGRKPFSAKRTLVTLERIQLVTHKSSHRVRTRTKVDPEYVAFLAIGPTAKGMIDGIRLNADIMVVAAPGTEADLVLEPGYESVTVMMSPDDLKRLLLDHGEVEVNPFAQRFEFRTCDGPQVQEFWSLCQKVANTAERRLKFFGLSEIARASAQTEIQEALVSVLSAEDSADRKLENDVLQRYSKIIKDVEAFSMRHLDGPVLVRDLCRHANVSERTLHFAFREILNMPPAAYLRRLRLHRARSDLQLGSKSSTTVSAVALDWGFWHFGEFSRAYKALFGEMPSATLKRKSPA